MNQEDRFQIISCVHRYLEAINARDAQGIDACVRYPMTVISDEGGIQVDALPILDMLPPDWDRSECAEVDVVALEGDKAHVLMRNIRRVRADGSLIEETSAFYVFRRGYDGWKMTAISVVSKPAGP